MRTLVFDTDPQTLVTIYDDGRVTVAVRSESWHAWGPPHKPVEAQVAGRVTIEPAFLNDAPGLAAFLSDREWEEA